MDFEYSDEQRMLRDTLAGFLADRYDFETRRAVARDGAGWRPEIWRALASELDILGATFPEAYGGQGGGAVENAIVMEEFGRALVLEPYLGSVVIGGGLLQRAGGALAREFLPRIAGGDAILALAHAEPRSRYHLADVRTIAREAPSGFVLEGRKSVVTGAPYATHFLVTARSAGGPRDAAGISLFLVDAAAPGITVQAYPTIDGGRAGEVTLSGVKVPASRVLGAPCTASPGLERTADEAACALCSEAVGAMQRMLSDTVAYAATRKQFGAPLASFQVLQHRMADMFVSLEQATALSQVATLKLSRPDSERAMAASAAKAYVGQAGAQLGQAAIQIHGGIGITEELALGHYFRRLTAIGAQFGDTDHHLRHFADLSLGAAA